MKKTILNITRDEKGNIAANFNEEEMGNFVSTIKKIFDDHNKNNCKCNGNGNCGNNMNAGMPSMNGGMPPMNGGDQNPIDGRGMSPMPDSPINS